jgi:hypothetical protein
MRHESPGSYEGIRAMLLYSTGYLDFIQGNYSSARENMEEGVRFFRESGDKYSLALGIHPLGMSAHFQNDYETARKYIGEALELHRELRSGTG